MRSDAFFITALWCTSLLATKLVLFIYLFILYVCTFCVYSDDVAIKNHREIRNGKN